MKKDADKMNIRWKMEQDNSNLKRFTHSLYFTPYYEEELIATIERDLESDDWNITSELLGMDNEYFASKDEKLSSVMVMVEDAVKKHYQEEVACYEKQVAISRETLSCFGRSVMENRIRLERLKMLEPSLYQMGFTIEELQKLIQGYQIKLIPGYQIVLRENDELRMSEEDSDIER